MESRGFMALAAAAVGILLRRVAVYLSVAATIALAIPAEESFAQFEVRGTIVAPSSTAVDSDVNDPNATYASNDSFAQSQPIPAPGTLGGYLNNPGAGPDGRSRADGDVVDVYRVSMPAGTRVTLFIAEDDGTVHDLDLFLFDGSNPATLVDSSMGTAREEQVEAPFDGDFYVAAIVTPDAMQAASNYLLTISHHAVVPTAFSLSVDDEFVAGQAIVRFEDSVPANAQADFRSHAQSNAQATGQVDPLRPTLAERAASVGLSGLGGAPGRNMLLERPRGAPRISALAALGNDAARTRLEACLPGDAALREKLETLWMIKKLRRRADVTGAEPNYLRRAMATPNDARYPDQWHYPLINLPQAWDVTTGSSETVVAVVDTGALRGHPDLQDVLPQGPGMGYDFVSSLTYANDGDGIDPDWNDPGNAPEDVIPSSFHGSHVMGTIAAATDNSTGVAGINWKTRVMPVRALGRWGIGSGYDIQQAVRYAAGLPNDSGTVPMQRADVINLSLGGGGFSNLEQSLYNEVREAGVIVIAAAGNDDSSVPSYPAAYDGVVSVSSVGPTKRLAPYSNFGRTIDVAAPGGDMSRDLDGDGQLDGVLSTLGQDFIVFPYIYDYLQGTSMASPHMAGVVSLMKAVNPGLTPALLDVLLRVGAITDDLGPVGRDDQYGYGLINALKAVSAAAGPAPSPPPELVVTPGSLNFGLVETSLPLNASNAGGGSLTVTGVTETSGGWLTIEATNVDATNLGDYTATADRGSLADGAYEATVVFESTEGSVTVPVVIQVAPGITGDAGFQYIRLVDTETLDTVAEIGAAADGGSYSFAFTDVPSGTFFLASGSDPDNDSNLCEGGESCGAYPVLNEPRPVTVEGNVSGLEFSTRYRTLQAGLPGSYDLVVLEGLPVAGGVGNAALVRRPGGTNNVYVRNVANGGTVKNFPVFGAGWLAADLAALDDVNSSGSPDIAALAVETASGDIAVQVRDGLSGAFIKNLFYLAPEWRPLHVLGIPSNDGNPGPEAGVLAVNTTTGEIVVQVKDAATNAFVRNVFFLNSQWTPLQAIVIPGFDANPGDEIGVLARNPVTGQIVVQVKDMLTNTFIQNVFFLNSNWDVVAAEHLPSANHAGPVIGVLASNRGTGEIVTQLKDASNNQFVRNIFHLGSAWTPRFLDAVPPISTTDDELAVLASNAAGKPIIQNRDAGTNAYINDINLLGPGWTILGMDAFGAGGSPGISVIAIRNSDAVLVVETYDAASGEQISSATLP